MSPWDLPRAQAAQVQRAAPPAPNPDIPFLCPARPVRPADSDICAEMAWVVLRGGGVSCKPSLDPPLCSPQRGPRGQDTTIKGSTPDGAHKNLILQCGEAAQGRGWPPTGLHHPSPLGKSVRAPTHPCRKVEMRASFIFSCSSSLGTVQRSRGAVRTSPVLRHLESWAGTPTQDI